MNWGVLLGAAGAAYLFFRKPPTPEPEPEPPPPNPREGVILPFRGRLLSFGAWPIAFPDAPGPTVLAMGNLGDAASDGRCRALARTAARSGYGHGRQQAAAARFVAGGCCGRAGVSQSASEIQRACAARAVARAVAFRF